jgi:hypothetical protein
MRKQKQNNNPDQLWLDFEQAAKRMAEAATTLEQAAQALHGHTQQQASAQTTKELRDRLNRVVKHLARERKLHWREIWRIVYRRLWDATGFDAQSRALARGITPIEAVCRYNKLEAALRVAEAV